VSKVASEKHWRRLVFRWTALKGLAAIVLFLVLALIIEFFIVAFFSSSGLADQFLLTKILRIPGTSSSFTITVSPLYHLIPLGAIFVLVSSWTYLTRYLAVIPRRVRPLKTTRPPTKKYPKAKKRRFKSFGRFSRWVSKKLQRASWVFRGFYLRVSRALLRVRGISYVVERLFFARAAIRSAVIVLVVFLISALGLYLLTYPTLIYDLAVGLHKGNLAFHGFVLKTIEMTTGLRHVFSPVNNVLTTTALGFYTAFEGFGASFTQPLITLDLVSKYTLCQNFAAWISALIAWIYGQYSARTYHRRSR